MNTITQTLIFAFIALFATVDMSQKQKFKAVKGTDLKTRWDAALKDARASHPHTSFWVGYSFNVRHGVGVEITPEPGIENQNLGLFFFYDPDVNSVRKFLVSNLDREKEPGLPIFWLGHAENKASLDFLRGLVTAKTGDAMSAYLIEAISMHDDQQADAMLEDLARQFPGKSEGTMATYWLKERATARQPFKDLPDNVPALARILDNDQESLPIRRRAAQALGMCADPAGVRALADRYKQTRDREVKELILSGAVNKVNEASVALFLDVAANETDSALRQQAYGWLAEKTGRRIAWNLEPGLRLFANDEISDEEQANLNKIRHKSPAEAISLLIRIAETDPKIGVRKAAVTQLGLIGGEGALSFFRKVLAKDAKGVPASAGLN